MSADWLSQLAPAHAPPAIGWWPPAPGWWGVAVLLLLIASAAAYWLHRPRRQLRRAALRELRRVEATALDDASLAADLANLMRRYAVARDGSDVASLNGDAWLAYIAEHGGTDLAGDSGRDLLRMAYGGGGRGDRQRWLQGTRAFLRSRE